MEDARLRKTSSVMPHAHSRATLALRLAVVLLDAGMSLVFDSSSTMRDLSPSILDLSTFPA